MLLNANLATKTDIAQAKQELMKWVIGIVLGVAIDAANDADCQVALVITPRPMCG